MNYGRRSTLFPVASKTHSVASSKRTSMSNMTSDSESVMGFDDFEDDVKDNVKRKTRNMSEKKRRDQFNMLVNELCSMVSVSNKKMDKSTVLKSTIAFLKKYQERTRKSQLHEIKEDWKPSFLSNDEFSQLMLEALDSFLVVFTTSGKILYVSDSVTSLLGHLPTDLVNQSLFNFIHEYDRERVSDLLQGFASTSTTTSTGQQDFEKGENQVSFHCYLQCGTLSAKEAVVYEGVEFTGTSRPWSGEEDVQSGYESYVDMMSSGDNSTCICCTVRLQVTKIIREMPFHNDLASEFTSRHSLGWKFLFLDHRAPPVIGYLPFEVLGTSGYDYYHPDDLERIAKCHEQLQQTGEGTSCHYRFLTKGQQWIWLKTSYYITYHQWNSKPEFIVCTNTVVRGQGASSSLSATCDRDCVLSKTSGFSEVRASLQKELNVQEGDAEMTLKDEIEREVIKPQSTSSVTPDHSSQLLESPVMKPEITKSSHEDTQETQISHELPQSTQVDSSTDNRQLFLHQHQQQRRQQQQDIQNTLANAHIYRTPAQRMLHDQLILKSEQLQDAIRLQQEELRQITEQLTHAQQLAIPSAQGDQDGSSSIMPSQHIQSLSVQAGPSSSSSLMVSPSQMDTINIIQQQQMQHSLPSAFEVDRKQPTPLQHVYDVQPQIQPCIPFQIVPEADDISLASTDMADT